MEKWILEVPQWEGKLYFDYATVRFLLLIAILLAGMALTLLGYKYMQELCTAVLGIGLGYGILPLVTGGIQNEVGRMSLFVVSLYLGVLLISLCLKGMRRALERYGVWLRMQYGMAALLGAAVTAYSVYRQIYRSIGGVMLLFGILAVVGLLHGRSAVKRRPLFYTYDHIIRAAERKENA